MEEYDFSSMDFDSFGGSTGEQPVSPDSEYKLVGGASLAVVDADQSVCDYLSGMFDGSVDAAYSLGALEPQIGLESRVIVMGPSCATTEELERVDEWKRMYPNVATVLVTAELSTELMQQAMRHGVRDVLNAPIESEQLVEAVHRVAEGLPTAQGATPAPAAPVALEDLGPGQVGQQVTVFSTKGGSGKSVTATNLGVVLARRASRPVVLIDGNLQFGDVAVMLKLKQSQHSVVDAIGRADELDSELIKSYMTTHEPSGLMVLPAPAEPAFADQYNAEDFIKIIELCKTFAEYVIVDLPAILDDLVFKTLEQSDEVVIVTGLDIPNIKNVRIAMNALSMLGVGPERIKLVLNRANSKVKLQASEVERALKIDAAAHVPSDVVVPISVNKGAPVVIDAPNSGVARAFEKFASLFIEGGVLAAPAGKNRRKFFG